MIRLHTAMHGHRIIPLTRTRRCPLQNQRWHNVPDDAFVMWPHNCLYTLTVICSSSHLEVIPVSLTFPAHCLTSNQNHLLLAGGVFGKSESVSTEKKEYFIDFHIEHGPLYWLFVYLTKFYITNPAISTFVTDMTSPFRGNYCCIAFTRSNAPIDTWCGLNGGKGREVLRPVDLIYESADWGLEPCKGGHPGEKWL